MRRLLAIAFLAALIPAPAAAQETDAALPGGCAPADSSFRVLLLIDRKLDHRVPQYVWEFARGRGAEVRAVTLERSGISDIPRPCEAPGASEKSNWSAPVKSAGPNGDPVPARFAAPTPSRPSSAVCRSG